MKSFSESIGSYLRYTASALALVVVIVPSTAKATAPGVKLLYSFQGGVDGQYPDTELRSDQSGNRYGTTAQGGLYGHGTVFELTPDGIHHVLYNFSGGFDGAAPSKGVYADFFGKVFYGTTSSGGTGSCPGGCGVIYKLAKTGDTTFAFELVYTFTGGADGSSPESALTPGFFRTMNFFGTTSAGGVFGAGVVYNLQQDSLGQWHYRVIYTFTGDTDGIGSSADLIIGRQFLVGTSPTGGTNGKGNIFELSPDGVGGWRFAIAYSFQDTPDGASPSGGLASAEEGIVYGVTYSGGSEGMGTVYELRLPENAYRVLYNFKGGSDGAHPVAAPAVPINSASPLYGTTTSGGDSACGCGTLYRLFNNSKGGWNENVSDRMPGAPGLGLVLDQLQSIGESGPLYGASVTGGASNNGAVYEFEP